MKLKIILPSLSLLFSFHVYCFEINTHQAITSCALSSKCITLPEYQGAQNLNYFVQVMQLNNTSYKTQTFDKYVKTYFNYARENKYLGGYDKHDAAIGKQINFTNGTTYLKGATDKDGNVTNFIDYSNTSFISLIEAGSILEDAIFSTSDFSGDGRFNNHFYSAQFSFPAETAYPENSQTPVHLKHSIVLQELNTLRKSDRASLADDITHAYGQRTDNISWALDESVAFNVGSPHIHTRKNDTNLPKAFESSIKHTSPVFGLFVPVNQRLVLLKFRNTYSVQSIETKGIHI